MTMKDKYGPHVSADSKYANEIAAIASRLLASTSLSFSASKCVIWRAQKLQLYS